MLTREARVADVPQIAKVHVDSWRTTYASIVPDEFLARMSYEDYEARWRSWMAHPGGDEGFYVAELQSGQIVGFASGGPRIGGHPRYEGALYAAYLLREYQRKGLGRRLLGAVTRRLVAQGKSSMLAWVLGENLSRHFYEIMGGKLLGSQQLEFGGVRLEEVAYGWDDTNTLITP
jgi:L-amino acid N-acyltransferase YncA